MKLGIWKQTGFVLLLGIWFYLQFIFETDKHYFKICIFNDNCVQADEIKDNGEKNLPDKVFNEVRHFTIVEILKIIFKWALLPIFFWLVYRFRHILKRYKKVIWQKIENKKTEHEFTEIFQEGDKKRLNEKYINNSLSTACSNDSQKKLNAIQQLTQYTEDSAFNGTIELLYKEKDLTFKYLLIKALNIIMEKRQKNNQ